MNWHIARDGNQLGTFNEQQVRDGLANGTLKPTDLAWKEGMGDWAAVSSVLNQAAPPAIPPVPPPFVAPEPRLQEEGRPGTAIASLICGILSLVLACLTGIPAIVLGVLAIKKIGKSNGALGGRGMAIAGLVLGSVGTMITGIAILAGLAVPSFNAVKEKGRMMQAATNARMIVIAMKTYAGDHAGQYPDAEKSDIPQTSNDAFRFLFKAGLIEDERLFTAPNSPYQGDNNIGTPPNFAKALERGENAWCLVKGVSDSASGNAPLIFEAPTEPASWPPMWNADAAGQKVPGRAWKSGKVVIGRNDGSVAGERLNAVRGSAVPLQKNATGKDLFTEFAEQGEYLDIAR
jgi:type II secretory pathway pseudopilin PulG